MVLEVIMSNFSVISYMESYYYLSSDLYFSIDMTKFVLVLPVYVLFSIKWNIDGTNYNHLFKVHYLETNISGFSINIYFENIIFLHLLVLIFPFNADGSDLSVTNVTLDHFDLVVVSRITNRCDEVEPVSDMTRNEVLVVSYIITYLIG